LGMEVSAWWLLFCGAMVITGTLGISLYLRAQIHKLPAHSSQLNVAETIFQTCKTYLIQQGKFLLMLFVLIAIAITFYLVGFGHTTEYEFSTREIEELRIEFTQKAKDKKLDEKGKQILEKLEALVGLKVAPAQAGVKEDKQKGAAREAFLAYLRAHLT